MFQQIIGQSGTDMNLWSLNYPASDPPDYTRQVQSQCLSTISSPFFSQGVRGEGFPDFCAMSVTNRFKHSLSWCHLDAVTVILKNVVVPIGHQNIKEEKVLFVTLLSSWYTIRDKDHYNPTIPIDR